MAVVTAVLAACFVGAPSSAAGRSCGWSGYSYAGLESATRTHGIAATVMMLSPPVLESGHVAAWVGVGGSGAGPGGGDEWLQVGVTASVASASVLYYEFKRPRESARLVPLNRATTGERYRVAVLEIASRPNWWRVWLEGRPASPPIFLPASHGAWEPLATAETWDGGVPGCNRYAYGFDRIVVATRPGGGWQPLESSYVLQDPGYRVIRRAAASFVATARA